MIKEQWLGKTFFVTLGALAACFLLAIGIFHNVGEPFALAVIGLGVLALTIWRFEFGLFAAFAGLFANSHGHLIETSVFGFPLSLRMTVFLAVMLGWLILVIARKIKLPLKDSRWWPFLPLFVAVAIGLIIGLKENGVMAAFDDGNAYFYLAYLFPILSVEWTALRRRDLLQVFAASATWVIILSLGLLYEFTHFPGWLLSQTYTFIRDTRTGELTKMTAGIFRVFLQAQFSVVVLAFLLAPFMWLKEINNKTRLWLGLGLIPVASTIIISLSRSFWVGMLAGIAVLILLIFILIKPKLKKAGSAIGLSAASGIVGIIFIVLIILFPLPYKTGSFSEFSLLLSSRTTDLGDAAISSRWNLLPELWKEIVVSPIIGSGFGEEVAFKTDDPRVLAIYPDGLWRTSALEWGWLELWLKMGILGPLAFLWLFGVLLKGLITDRERQTWLTIGLTSALVMLFVTHIFSPYLNHPIGLGFILFILPFLDSKKKIIPALSSEKSFLEKTRQLPQSLVAPVTKQNN
ncbi:MAG: hypothetical protein V1716_04070 [Candidatus Uhrbacteria bacterium]